MKNLFFILLFISTSIHAQMFVSPINRVPIQMGGTWTPSGLVGLWHFDTDMNASVGLNMTASGAGSATSTLNPAVGTGSITVDGASYAATVTGSTYSFPNTTFTVALWFKMTGTGGYVVSNGANNFGWGINVGTTFGGLIKNCVNAQVARNSVKVINDGKWHHGVAVFTTNTTTETSNVITTYVDGVLDQGAMVYPGSGAYCDAGTARSLAVGARNIPGTQNAYYTGSVDELAIWNVALTADQVKKIYQIQQH